MGFGKTLIVTIQTKNVLRVPKVQLSTSWTIEMPLPKHRLRSGDQCLVDELAVYLRGTLAGRGWRDGGRGREKLADRIGGGCSRKFPIL